MDTGHTRLNWLKERLSLLDNWHTFVNDQWFNLTLDDDDIDGFCAETDCIFLTKKQTTAIINQLFNDDINNIINNELLNNYMTPGTLLKLIKLSEEGSTCQRCCCFSHSLRGITYT